eukprot:6179961-Pleurochrysis_carterae.AAC.4
MLARTFSLVDEVIDEVRQANAKSKHRLHDFCKWPPCRKHGNATVAACERPCPPAAALSEIWLPAKLLSGASLVPHMPSTGLPHLDAASACGSASHDEAFRRFFGNVVPLRSEILVSEVESVQYLRDLYQANSSWIVHESLEHAELGQPALAKVKRLLEMTPASVGKQAALYVQLFGYPNLRIKPFSAKSTSCVLRRRPLKPRPGMTSRFL